MVEFKLILNLIYVYFEDQQQQMLSKLIHTSVATYLPSTDPINIHLWLQPSYFPSANQTWALPSTNLLTLHNLILNQ